MYRVSYVEYAAMVSRLRKSAEYFESEAINRVVDKLLRLGYSTQSLYIAVPEGLMKAVAIINMCEMSIVQFRDSNGEIDYADCGSHSISVLMEILNSIDEF